MRSAWKSDQGLVRENNEDFVLADEENGIFLLADGMGGGPAGEVASEVAARTAHESLLHQPDRGEIHRVLAEALAAAHAAVAKRALGEPKLHGMGTTLEMVVIRGGEAYTCHVGDSRIYLFRNGTLRQLTKDDNYAAMLAELGEVPLEEIPPHYRHMLTQAVGISDELVPELRSVDLKPADIMLICSDGLTGALGDAEIRVILGSSEGLDTVAEALVRAANERGGADNTSVVLVEPIPAVGAGTPPVARGTEP